MCGVQCVCSMCACGVCVRGVCTGVCNVYTCVCVVFGVNVFSSVQLLSRVRLFGAMDYWQTKHYLVLCIFSTFTKLRLNCM